MEGEFFCSFTTQRDMIMCDCLVYIGNTPVGDSYSHRRPASATDMPHPGADMGAAGDGPDSVGNSVHSLTKHPERIAS